MKNTYFTVQHSEVDFMSAGKTTFTSTEIFVNEFSCGTGAVISDSWTHSVFASIVIGTVGQCLGRGCRTSPDQSSKHRAAAGSDRADCSACLTCFTEFNRATSFLPKKTWYLRTWNRECTPMLLPAF